MSVKLNLVEGASQTEVAGVIEAATQIVAVVEVESPLFDKAMAQTLVPQPGESLNSDNPDVKVIRRVPVIVGINNDVSPKEFTLKITIDYELQRPDVPAKWPLRGGGSLQQIQTTKNLDGTDILVTSNAEGATPELAEVNIFQPQQNSSWERVKATLFPEVEVAKWLNMVNDSLFRGQPIGTWMVVNVDYQIVDEKENTPRYNFTYEIENNPKGWDTSVGFKKDNGYIEEGTLVDVVVAGKTSFGPLMNG